MHKDIELSLVAITGVIISLLIFWMNLIGAFDAFTNITVITYQKIKQDLQQTTYHTMLRVKSLVRLTDLKHENLRLRKEITQLQQQMQDLTYQCKLVTFPEDNAIIVQVINYPNPGYIVAYNPGEQLKDPNNELYVTTPTRTLVGRVISTKKNWLTIQTIYAKDARWLVFLPKTKEYGILTYTNDGLKISDIPINSNLNKEDPVYLYSPDVSRPIYVGHISQIRKDPTQPYLNITVSTAWRLNDLDQLKLVSITDGTIK